MRSLCSLRCSALVGGTNRQWPWTGRDVTVVAPARAVSASREEHGGVARGTLRAPLKVPAGADRYRASAGAIATRIASPPSFTVFPDSTLPLASRSGIFPDDRRWRAVHVRVDALGRTRARAGAYPRRADAPRLTRIAVRALEHARLSRSAALLIWCRFGLARAVDVAIAYGSRPLGRRAPRWRRLPFSRLLRALTLRGFAIVHTNARRAHDPSAAPCSPILTCAKRLRCSARVGRSERVEPASTDDFSSPLFAWVPTPDFLKLVLVPLRLIWNKTPVGGTWSTAGCCRCAGISRGEADGPFTRGVGARILQVRERSVSPSWAWVPPCERREPVSARNWIGLHSPRRRPGARGLSLPPSGGATWSTPPSSRTATRPNINQDSMTGSSAIAKEAGGWEVNAILWQTTPCGPTVPKRGLSGYLEVSPFSRLVARVSAR